MFFERIHYFHYHSNRNFHVMARKNDVHNQNIATYSHTKFYQGCLNSFLVMSGYMFLQYFYYFCYHSNHNFHAKPRKNDNQHIATCSHTKFHQASLNSF